jgi:hypothetical protein
VLFIVNVVIGVEGGNSNAVVMLPDTGVPYVTLFRVTPPKAKTGISARLPPDLVMFNVVAVADFPMVNVEPFELPNVPLVSVRLLETESGN